MSDDTFKAIALRIDPEAATADPAQPAFVARPRGAPVYHGFPVLSGSETDGWFIGIITEPNSSEPQSSGDAYVVAPDGSRAGLIWDLECPEFEEVCAPDPERWGVYSVRFPHTVRSEDDLIHNFQQVLHLLKAQYIRVFGHAPVPRHMQQPITESGGA